MSANKKQIGGTHYKKGGGEEHWDRAWRLKYDPFQYIILNGEVDVSVAGAIA